MKKKQKVCFVSVDVEPDFDVSVNTQGAKAGLPANTEKTGERKGFRGIENLDRVIDILKRAGVSATFFVTGQVLENYPAKFKYFAELLTNQQTQRFEIACHTYYHKFWTKMNQQERKQDLEKFLTVYGKVFGLNKKPVGFRAPSHLIDEQGLTLLQEADFLYDSSILPHYPFFKKYRGYQGKAPKTPYFPSPQNCRASRAALGEIRRGQPSGFLEIPVAGQLGGIPLAGAWISRAPHWFYRVLFSFYSPKFITVSMHPWDALNFEGRHTSPQDFLDNLEKLLYLLKKRNYSFLTGKEIVEMKNEK